jgi:hypothetical protein
MRYIYIYRNILIANELENCSTRRAKKTDFSLKVNVLKKAFFFIYEKKGYLYYIDKTAGGHIFIVLLVSIEIYHSDFLAILFFQSYKYTLARKTEELV